MSSFWRSSVVSQKEIMVDGGGEEGGRESEASEVEGEVKAGGNETVYMSAASAEESDGSVDGGEGGGGGRKTRQKLSSATKMLRERIKKAHDGRTLQETWEREREREKERKAREEEREKRKRSEEVEEQEGEAEGKKVRKESPDKEKDKGVMGKLEGLIESFRAETMEALKGVNEDNKGIKGDIKKVKEGWENWEVKWEEEKGRIWQKLDEMDKKGEEERREREEERRGKERERRETEERIKELERKTDRMEQLEKKLEELQEGGGGGGEGEGRERTEAAGGREESDFGERLRELEWREEKLEREKRKKNLVIRRMNIGAGDGRREVEELVAGVLGVEVDIQWMRKLGRKDREGREAVLLGLKDEAQKRRVMENRGRLRGRKERLENDLTWRERRRQWELEGVAEVEKERRKEVRVGRGRIWIDRELWTWDEIRRKLVNSRGVEWNKEEAPGRADGRRGSREEEGGEENGGQQQQDSEAATGE